MPYLGGLGGFGIGSSAGGISRDASRIGDELAFRDRSQPLSPERFQLLLCRYLQTGETLRRPILERLIGVVGPACGLGRDRFDRDRPERAGPWVALRDCAARTPALKAQAQVFLAEVGTVNLAVCAAAFRDTELDDAAAVRAAGQRGGSAMPRPRVQCSTSDPDAAWRGIANPRR